MIPNIPQQGQIHNIAQRRGAGGPEMPPSAESTSGARNASAPGQIAKTRIADATASGAELPANIQGKAASAIAHGINMETFFASFMPAVELPAGNDAGDGESAPPVDAGDGADPKPENGATTDATSLPSPASDGESTAPPESAAASSYQIAATLLESLVEPESGEVV